MDIVIEATGLASHVKDADLVITGEGRIDGQTIYGKTPMGVAKTAKRYRVPVIGIAGSLADGHEAVLEHGIDMVFTIVPGVCPGRCNKPSRRQYGAYRAQYGDDVKMR